MKNDLLLYFLLLLKVGGFSQTQAGTCGNAVFEHLNVARTIPSNSNASPDPDGSNFCSTPFMMNYFDAISNYYIPTNASPMLYFKVNFIFLLHPQNATVFNTVPQSQIIADANTLVNSMNSWFQTCGNIPSTKPVPNPSPLLNDPKIRLVLNRVIFDSSSTLAISNSFGANNFNTLFPYDVNTAFNIFFYTDSLAGGAGWALPGKYCALAASPLNAGGVYIPNTIFNNPRLLWHELGHGLGFLGDHYGGQHNIVDPSGGSYIPDDAALDFGVTSNCTAPTSFTTPPSINNNLMAGSACREVLSARQIGAFHYLVASNITKKFTQFKNERYPYSPFLNSPIVYNYSGTHTFNNQSNLTFDSIIVKAGANVTFENMLLIARQDGKIRIEPGGHLKLKCVTIVTQNENIFTWNGIDVCGNSALEQIPFNQGLLTLEFASIQQAVTAVSIGRHSAQGELIPNSGGGIINASYSLFEYNQNDVDFAPYLPLRKNTITNLPDAVGSIANKSWFKHCKFLTGQSNTQNKKACVRLNRVAGIPFIACEFNPGVNPGHQVDYGIYSLNSSFYIKSRNGAHNRLFYFKNNIYANGSVLNDRIEIDSAQFNVNGSNGIFMTNVLQSSVKACTFNFQNSKATQLSGGIYLNNCHGFKIENNRFYSNTSFPSAGIFIRQCGLGTNAIYDNQFSNLGLGVWSIGQNYNPESLGSGLLINCNEFQQCIYNIGVVESTRLNPNYPNYTGIASVQGVTFMGDVYNVRNIYDVVTCKPYDENMFYVRSKNDFAINSHGSFNEPQFHFGLPTYSSCSNITEIADISGSIGSSSKPVYCSLGLFSKLSSTALTSKIQQLSSQVNTLVAQQTQLIDGGQTQALLDSLAKTEVNREYLKNLLLAQSPYLSNTVLKTFFSDSNTSVEHLMALHNANKPVSPDVWKVMLNKKLDLSSQKQLNQQQYQNALSIKNTLVAKTELLNTHLGLACLEQLSRLSTDTLPASADSLMAFYDGNLLTNSKILKIKMLIQLEQFGEANRLLNQVEQQGGLYTAYAFIERELIQLRATPSYQSVLEKDEVKKEQIKAIRNACNYLAEGIASSLLAEVWQISEADEEKPLPLKSGIVIQPNQNPVIGIEELVQNKESSIRLYPNPANSFLNIETNTTSANSFCSIYDLSGQLLLKEKVQSKQLLNISHLPDGLYILKLDENGQIMTTQKLVIMR